MNQPPDTSLTPDTPPQALPAGTPTSVPTHRPPGPGQPALLPLNEAYKGSLFLNRELSWLEFNSRVLHEALDERTPLLERAAFLAIFNSNLDEYVQKRVGGLKRQLMMNVATRTLDGMTAREQLAQIRRVVTEQLALQGQCFKNDIRPNLQKHGIFLLEWNELTRREKEFASDYYQQNLFPVLTPLAVDPGHPFPFISNLSTSLGVMLRHPPAVGRRAADRPFLDRQSGTKQFARIKVPQMLPQWIRLNPPEITGTTPARGKYRFVKLVDIIQHNLDDLFPGMIIDEVLPFRVTRNADVERDEEDAEDLLELIEQELRDRRFAQAVRLEVDQDAKGQMVEMLREELDIEEEDIYRMPAEIDYNGLWEIHSLNLPHLKFEPWTPIVPVRLADDEADIFSVIRNSDLLVHHPYESFTASVERFIKAAVKDPKVIAIKLTLYRTGDDSPFIPELIRAAEAGKQVVCLVELKARFDEARNIQVAQRLEKAGVHVVYGIVGLKTHTKTSLIVRQDPDRLRTYCHIGTGNYNPKTASLYTDLGLFTCNPQITGEMVEMFHFLTGHSRKRDFNHLLIAPINMRKRFTEMIEREIRHAHQWRSRGADESEPTRPTIIAKMNSLEDRAVCQKLYEASQAGVNIKLIIRGFCCLRPGVPGLSENITVQSVIGRFLEHSRIFYFHNGASEPGGGEYYIGSADWMYRNLNNRVECITPITDPTLKRQLKHILDVVAVDDRQSWDLHGDGRYVQRRPSPERPQSAIGTHKILMDESRQQAIQA